MTRKYYFFGFFLVFLSINGFSQKIGQTFSGEASYYADKFHGRKTASGEKYSKWQNTAAHRTLPFGTMLKVENLSNHKSVIVKVNDRGPYSKHRVLDLSKAAAAKIGLIKTGVAKVKVTIIGKNGTTVISGNNNENQEQNNNTNSNDNAKFTTGKTYNSSGKLKSPKGYGVQVAAFKNMQNALNYCEKLRQKGFYPRFIQVGWNNNAKIFRVVQGAYKNKERASKTQNLLKKSGFNSVIVPHFK